MIGLLVEKRILTFKDNPNVKPLIMTALSSNTDLIYVNRCDLCSQPRWG